MLPHFRQRLAERGLIWVDVLTVLESPTGVRGGKLDPFGRPKWLVAGSAISGEPVEVVCVLDTNAYGDVTVFITVY